MEKIFIVGSESVGKSTIAFNIACGLAVEGRSVGIIEICKEKSFIADIMGKEMGAFEPPSKIYGNIKVMLIKENEDIDNLTENKLWEESDYLIIDMPSKIKEKEKKMLEKADFGKAIVVISEEEEIEDSDKLFQNSKIEVIGYIENKLVKYNREIKSKLNIIAKIPYEVGMEKEKYDGIPYIYKNFNSDAIMELKSIVDRIIDFEYGEEESELKRIIAGVCIDCNEEVASKFEKAVKIKIVKIEGNLYRSIENIECSIENIKKADIVITSEEKKEKGYVSGIKQIENSICNYIEEINKHKKHSCH